MSLLLDDREKERFVAYLRRCAESEKGVADQMERLGMPEAHVLRFRAKAAAYALVANDIASYERFTVGGPEDGSP